MAKFEIDEDLIINSGDAHEYAKLRKSLQFKDYVLIALEQFAANEKEFRQLKEYFNTGGGMTWADILKAVRDDSDKGKEIIELFRMLTLSELEWRGVYAPEVDKPIPKWK